MKIKDEMDNFIEWLHSCKDLHAVVLASEVHYKFVSIHPFMDGNGRTARLLMNLILLQSGYPAAVIKMTNRYKIIIARRPRIEMSMHLFNPYYTISTV